MIAVTPDGLGMAAFLGLVAYVGLVCLLYQLIVWGSRLLGRWATWYLSRHQPPQNGTQPVSEEPHDPRRRYFRG